MVCLIDSPLLGESGKIPILSRELVRLLLPFGQVAGLTVSTPLLGCTLSTGLCGLLILPPFFLCFLCIRHSGWDGWVHNIWKMGSLVLSLVAAHARVAPLILGGLVWLFSGLGIAVPLGCR